MLSNNFSNQLIIKYKNERYYSEKEGIFFQIFFIKFLQVSNLGKIHKYFQSVQKVCRWEGSNLLPAALETAALPLS